MEITGGAAVVEVLRQEGVTHVFGLVGSSTMEILDALVDASEIRFVGVRHEQFAVHMADGYARASGRIGVCLAGQNGPGASNLVTGVAQAFAANSPVLSIAGDVSSSHKDRDAFQEIDQHALFAPITKRTFTVHRVDRIPEILRRAVQVALTGKPGPVHVNLPRDILAASLPAELVRPEANAYRSRPCGNQGEIYAAAQLLASAQRPLILAGGGVIWGRASDALARLAERLGCPVAASAGHTDVLPYDHPLSAGQVGPRGNAVASRLARECDVLLALGTRLGFNTTFYDRENLSPSARIIQVDIDPAALGRYFPIELGICGDAGVVADAIADALPTAASAPSQWLRQFQVDRQALWEERRRAAADVSVPLKPAAIFGVLRECLPRNTALTLDAGTVCLQATDQLPCGGAPSLFTPLDYGLVGFSYACGLGVKAAMPERPVVSLIGDGGFGMCMAELGTAVTSGLHTVVVVLNNRCWGAEKAYQRDFFSRRFLGVDLVNPRYDRVADLFGARGYYVQGANEFRVALEAALADSVPAVIEVEVDPDALISFRRDSFAHRAQPQPAVSR